jgi:hypothetical protein
LDDEIFYISYRRGLDDDCMIQIYKAQNQWMQEVEVIPLGKEHNIDQKFHIGLEYGVSLREFIIKQLIEVLTEHHPVDIENGGRGNRAVIIVLPKYRADAEKILAQFHQLTHHHHGGQKPSLDDQDNDRTKQAPDEATLLMIDDCLQSMESSEPEEQTMITQQTSSTA